MPNRARVAADVVEREQPDVAVERGVLDALGHHRRRGLLEARDPLLGLAVVEVRAAPASSRPRGPRPTARRRRCGRRAATRAAARCRRRGSTRSQPLDLGGERRRRLLELGLERELGERPRLAGQRRVQRGQRLLPGRVDEQRRDVVEELVADRARRPASRAALGLGPAIEDLLDPHVLDAARRPAAAGTRRGRPCRRGGRCAARRRARRARATAPAGASPRRPRGPPGARRRGGRCRRSAGSRPALADRRRRTCGRSSGSLQQRLALVGRHVVRDDVEHDPQPGLARRGDERAERLLAAELGRDRRRVDDVVAVRRARSRAWNDGGRYRCETPRSRR